MLIYFLFAYSKQRWNDYLKLSSRGYRRYVTTDFGKDITLQACLTLTCCSVTSMITASR
jgi:hypothetical protein